MSGSEGTHLVLDTLQYTNAHEWVEFSLEDSSVGITDYAQSSLGDIVFVELPELGRMLERGESFGVVESIKSVSDLYAPLSGEVVAVNDALESSPELLNESPYKSWIIKIKPRDKSEEPPLLSPSQYLDFCKEQD